MAEIVQQFNGEAASAPGQPTAWPHSAFVALAEWFAAQLPETCTSLTSDKPPDAPDEIIPITPAHRQAFIAAMTEAMKKIKPHTSHFGSESIEVTTAMDTPHGDNEFPALWDALEKAGIGGAFVDFEFTKNYIYKDGQVFARGQPLEHEGKPATPYIRQQDVDFTGCPWMRADTRYLVVPLEAGKPVVSGRRKKDGSYDYRKKIAGEGEVLVVPAYGAEDFASLTQAEALNMRYHDKIRFSMVCKAADYATGAKNTYGTMEMLDDKGHCRQLSHPFQLFTATESFGTGYSFNYYVMKPGDCLTRTPGNGDEAHFEITPKTLLDEGRRIFLPCAQDGTLADLTTLDKPVTASRPLKLKTPVEPP